MGFLDRLLGRRPRTRIADAPEGVEVQVGGTVSCPSPLIAPYTGRPCVYWRLEIMQQRMDGTTSGIVDDKVDFAIEDGSGRAEVIAEVCVFDVVANYVEMERVSDLSKKTHELVMKYGWGPFADIAQVNVCEAIVAIGEDIEIKGVGRRELLPAAKLMFSRRAQARGKNRDAVFLRPGDLPR